jgi:hypothetical protein
VQSALVTSKKYLFIFLRRIVPVPNYYEILRVSPNASQDEIKKSFRNLALQHHPDKNKNSEESKQKFMKIIEAYEVLSDEQTRKDYDNNALQKRGTRTRWTPSADFGTVYSYEEIRRRYRPSNVRGGMWDISDKATFGIWKATILLFACLAALLIYIMLLS